MPPFIDIAVGTSFGLWTTIGPREGPAKRFVSARCVCGHVGLVRVADLRSGHSRGCRSCSYITMGLANTKHGESGSRLYDIWSSMKGRCTTYSCTGYREYGGRGVTFCEQWIDYIPFRDWATANGYTDLLTIDRIDPDGDYEPDNCRWITRSENSKRVRRGARRVRVSAG